MLIHAGEQLGAVLKDVAIADKFIPYVANVTADYVTDAKEVKLLLERQVASSVRWQQTIERLISDGAEMCIRDSMFSEWNIELITFFLCIAKMAI